MAAADAAIEAYSSRFHAAFAADGVHHVASPLGAWMLLALAAGRRDGPLDEVLGMGGAEAGDLLEGLLSKPWPTVAAALAWWIAPQVRTAALDQRVHRLADVVVPGDMPTKAEADAWTNEHTLGLIERFPGAVNAATGMVLASMVATRASWNNSFSLVPATELGTGPWTTSLTEVLQSELHHQVSLRPSKVGLLGVHLVQAQTGLVVYSVIGPPEVGGAELIDAWFESSGDSSDLFELPLGEGHAWSLHEVNGVSGRVRATAVLPAWSATSNFDLTAEPSLGISAAIEQLNADLAVRVPFYAGQVVRADYTRTGFAAAAMSEIVATAASLAGPERHLRVRFNRPFAVFAYTSQRGSRVKHLHPWHGLPVFSGWISEPTDAAGT